MYIDVAIIVANYKQDQWLPQAVYSAENQIAPLSLGLGRPLGPMPNFKVIVSTDEEGIGQAKHLNRIISETMVDWIIVLDADDLIPSHYLYEMWQLHLLYNDRLLHAVKAPVQFFSGARLDRINGVNLEAGKQLPFGMSCMFSRFAWSRLNGFDEVNLKFCMADLDFWYRMQLSGYHFADAHNTFMMKRDVPNSFLKSGEDSFDPVAYFNQKHGTQIVDRFMPYRVPSTDIL